MRNYSQNPREAANTAISHLFVTFLIGGGMALSALAVFKTFGISVLRHI